MLTVYGRPNSSNVQRVLWTLGELGLEYDNQLVGGSFGGTDAPDYLAMNPIGLVPTLRDGDLTVWNSEAIIRYLAARYGAGGPLWPEDPAARARADSWIAYAGLELQSAIGPVFLRSVRTKRAEQDLAALAKPIERLNERFAFFDARLAESPYLAGPDFSLAEIPAGIFAYRYFTMRIERSQLPNLEAWYQRLCARPAFQRHVMLPLGTCLEEWKEHERALG